MESFLQIDGLCKSFGDRVIFDGLTLNIAQGEKVGLIARNGQGKSTLLDVIAGNADYRSGTITFRRDIKTAYLVQTPQFPAGATVIRACCASDSDEMLLKARRMLTILGVPDFERPVSELSGGQAKRVALASALISEPDFLILDEPTNHLDVEITEWLEEYLTAGRLTLLMVTHDRYLLDRVCNRIVEIDDFRAYSYQGNYSYYLEKRQERLDAESSQRESDLNLYRRELDWMRRMPCARGGKARYRKESFHDLEERLQHRRDERSVTLDVKASYIGKKIFEIDRLNKSFGDKVILKDFSYVFTKYEKLGIIGGNGVGKSTFLKMLLGLEQPDSGVIDRGTTLKIGYYSQEGMSFNENERVIDAVTAIADHIELDDGRRMSAGQFLQKFLFPPKTQYCCISKLSGGERRRLYLCTILMRSPNFLILDEPTNDLDIMTLQVLEEYISQFKGCVIAVSHDRYFMDRTAQHLFVFEGDGKVTDFPSSYSDYMEWKVLKEDEEKASLQNQSQNRAGGPSGAAPQQRGQASRPAKLTFREKREMEQLETELEQLETEKAALEEELGGGSLPYDVLQAKSARIGEIIDRIDEATMRWLELSDKC
ncbi:MAG: ABC-F family ATP-binding cassette domain-containing protein [Bacteroidaceae bacterium]|nr:ABC-F family ATP-binding cassette domain-containing protein [Bacteroidaceae bacterium]